MTYPIKALTRRQRDALVFVKDFQTENGYSPSYDEIGDALGISKTAVAKLVDGLESRGAVRRLPNRARAIQVLQ